MSVRGTQEHGAEHHRKGTKSGDAGRDVGFFVEGKTQFDEMQHAVPVEREFNQPQESVVDGGRGGT